jgi:hypothetical protein
MEVVDEELKEFASFLASNDISNDEPDTSNARAQPADEHIEDATPTDDAVTAFASFLVEKCSRSGDVKEERTVPLSNEKIIVSNPDRKRRRCYSMEHRVARVKPPSKRNKKLEDDEIEKGVSTHCACSPHCLDGLSRLSFGIARKQYLDLLSEKDKTQFLIDHYADENTFVFQFDHVPVLLCDTATMALLAISREKLLKAKALAKKGEEVPEHARKFQTYEGTKTSHVTSWLHCFINDVGMPSSEPEEILLPHYLTWKDIYSIYESSYIHSPELIASIELYRAVVAKKFNKVHMARQTALGACPNCIYNTQQLRCGFNQSQRFREMARNQSMAHRDAHTRQREAIDKLFADSEQHQEYSVYVVTDYSESIEIPAMLTLPKVHFFLRD